MSVIGAADVDAAAGAGVLRIGARDIVTPLARERARESGVQIVVGTPGTTAALAGDGRSGAPHRTGAPLGGGGTVAAGQPPADGRPMSSMPQPRGLRGPAGTNRPTSSVPQPGHTGPSPAPPRTAARP